MNKTKEWLAKAVANEAMAVKEMPFDYPKGMVVQWKHGDHMRRGEVLAHNPYSTRVQVQCANQSTVWIDIVSVVDRPALPLKRRAYDSTGEHT
jgi:hypothetical protein